MYNPPANKDKEAKQKDFDQRRSDFEYFAATMFGTGESLLQNVIIADAAAAGYVILGYNTFYPACRQFDPEVLLLEKPLSEIEYDNAQEYRLTPSWLKPILSKKGFEGWKVSGVEMAKAIRKRYGVFFSSGVFWDGNGQVKEDEVRATVYASLMPFFDTVKSALINDVVAALKSEAYCKPQRPPEDRIYLLGDEVLDLSTGKHEKRSEMTFNRLPIKLDENATCPTWIHFLNDLLKPDEIPLLQEFLGYCLVPTTKAQKALFIRGAGGEGKSRITKVVNDIFGASAYTGKLPQLEDNRFMLANLERRLLFIDDDLNSAAFKETGTIKQVITAEMPIAAERKGQDFRLIESYARIFAVGQDFPKALYDKSDGFYRRLILLECKPKDPNRVDDPHLSSKLYNEREGIFLWMLAGLMRLRANSYKFSESSTAEKLMNDKIYDDDSARMFLNSDWIEYAFTADEKKEFTIASAALSDAYRLWCQDNDCVPVKNPAQTTFPNALKKAGCERCNVPIDSKNKQSRRVKGYIGVRLSEKARSIFHGYP